MHLFAAKPGAFDDGEGIIDLDQTPAELVVLSGADSVLSLLAQAAETLPDHYPTLRLANALNLTKPAALDLYRDKVLDARSPDAPQGVKVVVLSMLGGASYWRYGLEQLREWAEQRTGRTLIVVPGEDYEDRSLLEAGTVSYDAAHRIWRYLREGGLDNTRAMFDYLGQQWLTPAAPDAAPPPKTLPKSLVYRTADPARPEAPPALLLMYRSHIQAADTGMFDDFVDLLTAQGFNVTALAVASLKDKGCFQHLDQLLIETDARLVINTTGFAIARAPNDALASLPAPYHSPLTRPVPILQVILASTTRNDWATQSAGLRSRDIAMQVSLPELDGRIITRAVGFKAQLRRHARVEFDSVRFELDAERARFVAELAWRWQRLQTLPPAQKRVGLILANYPASDATLGNGVGLDTPASTLLLLSALKEGGFSLPALPDSGDDLIHLLRQGITNTADSLYRPAAQTLPLADYERAFAALPALCQEAITARWGTPDQDPRLLQTAEGLAFAVAGHCLGNVFIGVQPTRGYDIDQEACYHDPDLVPPHAYLAFYFWLRHTFRSDALVHVGTHGNLEWLPGKSLALSDQCWPEIALGPMPHLYPFIVNDPGEGAQAKRRTQAVIIDHLMPPTARADIYGDLAELEQLVDEYYQALDVDPRREARLKTLILEKARTSHVLDDITGLDADADLQAIDDETLLAELDAYLCDIKESQVRNGLHILGQLPAPDILADMLVALLRLPRNVPGDTAAPEREGLLHAIARDHALPDTFDPLATDTAPWSGPCPPTLAALSEATWRTAADTRERLELRAQQLIRQWLATGALPEAGPTTTAVLSFAERVLLPALHLSVDQERQALIDGLNGRFIAPGASGAPSRGRLDTLPTGRNFYTVDSRAIPSPTAWALGKRAADELIERHLQEHGDYPRHLGMSVWGTATMRTGGDDLAQAFALMGVRPLWAPGTSRVVNIEVIPAFQLGRPRVDVTLRISGFFRDAFPNLITLFDKAVHSLADYEEPGNGNTVRAHVLETAKSLEEEGLSRETAQRQARFRIFGNQDGSYGSGLQGLLDQGAWEHREELAAAYVQWSGYAYTGSEEGMPKQEAAFAAFETQLRRLEAIVHNRDNPEQDILDASDYAQFQGGMANAASLLSGRSAALYVGDHTHPSAPRLRTLREDINRTLRARVLNPKWHAAMRRHGYKGAADMAASVQYVYAFDATTGLIEDYQYAQLCEALLDTPENRAFFEHHNPDALRDMSERLLEAIQRGLWSAPGDWQDTLEATLLALESRQEAGTP